MDLHISIKNLRYKELISRCFIFFSLYLSISNGVAAQLDYQEPPLDNPLKGFVPYSDRAAENYYPHSLEFFYVALDEVLIDFNDGAYEFNWALIESGLNAAKARGNQGIFRIYSEYPKRGNEIPEFLRRSTNQGGLGVEVQYTDQFGGSYSPNYQNPTFRAALVATINALADEYDGDDRIAFLELGLLGFWGEWHNHATTSYKPNDQTKKIVIDAYEAAFSKTQLLTRYPRGENNGDRANYNKPFGYHDDSFHWSTVNSFLELMKDAGALDQWQSYVIGGEVFPALNDFLFTDTIYVDNNGNKGNTTPFINTIEASHASYMRLSAVFKENVAASRITRANASVRRMGYNLHFNEATITPTSKNSFTISATLENRGVAPFYYDWPMTLGLLDASGGAIEEISVNWLISNIQPNNERTFSGSFTTKTAIPAGAQIALRVPNIMTGGRPVRFSNTTQQINGNAWLLLGKADALAQINKPHNNR